MQIAYMERVFIFGFGSLINDQARTVTVSASKAYPVRIQGLKRFWNGRKDSTLGVTKDNSHSCNGIIFEISLQELPALDTREYQYRRISVDTSNVEFLETKPESFTSIWTYEPLNITPLNPEYPIFQSYLDVVITGCLEISEEFAIEFIKSTHGWNGEHILKDRENPQYERHLKEVDVATIDSLLEQYAYK